MASWKRTRNGNIYVVHSVNGNIIQGQPQGGHPSVDAAKRWAKNNISGITRKSQVTKF